MNKKRIALKIRLPAEGFYLLILKRIEFCKDKNEDTICFPRIFSKLCASLQITKHQAWELLYLFQDLGLIQIICGHGIKLNYQIGDKIK
jgi:hypothetical protein